MHEWENPFGVVKIEGIKIVGFEEKPVSMCHINAGVYVLNQEALNLPTKRIKARLPSPTLYQGSSFQTGQDGLFKLTYSLKAAK